ncbi:MAG: thioesterase family protein [Amphiplicatus sp.]
MSVSYSQMLQSFREEEGAFLAAISADWMQGRTTYGGLAAALSLEATLRAHPSLPPLRSAQVSFIGPAGGEVRVAPQLLRQGKSVAFVGADLVSNETLAARSVFAFGAARASRFNASYMHAPPLRAPDECEPYVPEGMGPPFASHFDTRLIKGGRPMTGSAERDHYIWVRHRDERARSLSALVALADMPPPAMMPMFPEFAPISTVTWSFNMLADNPETVDGWWLLQTRAENAAAGYSSQDMIVWDRMGRAVIAGRQSVAIFI